MVKPGANFYRLNLIRELREREIKTERRQRLSVILSLGCFGFFILSVLYSGLTIMQMEKILTLEEDKVRRLQQEYQKYKAARLIVDKSDIELLNDLSGKGIFWTKKLASLAKHLPENYWITSFRYVDHTLNIQGGGLANPKQDQLLILDRYLDRLRSDTTFSDTFTKIQLNLAERVDDGAKIAFSFSAFTPKWKK